MSKRINVNPDHYKVAGRERPGDAVVRASKPKAAEEARSRWEKRQQKKAKGS